MTEPTKEQIHATADAIAKEMTDKGVLIRSGFVLFKRQFFPDVSEEQSNDMMFAFMAGAQHLFGSVMGILDPGAEPTEKDMERMDSISREIEEFTKILKKEWKDAKTS